MKTITTGTGPYMVIPAGTLVDISNPHYDADDPKTHTNLTISLSEDICVTTASSSESVKGELVKKTKQNNQE